MSPVKHVISAGGVVRKFINGEVFIVLIRPIGRSGWLLPKGHVENGETIEEAAIREIGEETGLKDIKILKKLGIKERMSFQGNEYKTIHYFLCECGGNGELSADISDGPDKLEARWFPLSNLPKLFWDEQKEIILGNIQTLKTTF